MIDRLFFLGDVYKSQEDVKAAADYVTAPIDEDGISKAMKHFGII